MEVECSIFGWTATGMRLNQGIGEYIERREVERLLEKAHQRGREQRDREIYSNHSCIGCPHD